MRGHNGTDSNYFDIPSQRGHRIPASQPASQSSVGIPIGNLTSQFFANIYLNGLDHFIKEKLKCRFYLRYMDDFVIFHHDKSFLWEMKRQVVAHLEELKLTLHDNKCRIYKTTDGVPFLGTIVFSEGRRLNRENVLRFKRRMKRFQDDYRTGRVELPHIHQSIQSWIGHASHANTMRLRTQLFSEFVFQRETED